MNNQPSQNWSIREFSIIDVISFVRFYSSRSEESKRYFSPFPFGLWLYYSTIILFISNHMGRVFQLYKYTLRIKSFVCATPSGEIIGFAYIRWQSSEQVNLGIAVKKECSGLGVGQELMESLISEARAHKLNEIHLQVHVENSPAISLYKKFGFEIVDTMEVTDGSSGRQQQRHKMVKQL